MKLHELPATTVKKSKRVGRGYGSGRGGHTSSRGSKGQRARVGRGIPLWFEGGQLPFVKRLPYLRGKLRFSSLQDQVQLVTLSMLEKLTEKEVNPEVLMKHGMVKSVHLPVKITAVGSLTRAVTCTGMKTTASAKAMIEKVGGSLT